MRPGLALRTAFRLLLHHPDLVATHLRGVLRLRQVSREQKRGDGISARPLGITLKPVLSCNLRCRMCSFAANAVVEASPHESLPLETWKRLVDDVVPWRPYLWLTGGEPTLYPHVRELVQYIKKQGLVCGMTTNGTTLTALAESFVDAGLDVLVVSIDGVGEVHNEVRGHPRAFERAVAGLKEVMAWRSRKRSQKPLLMANCALTPSNYRCVPELAKWAQELGLDALGIQHLWMMTDDMIAAHNARWAPEHVVSHELWGGMDSSGMDAEVVTGLVAELRRGDYHIPVLLHPDLEPHEILTYYNSPTEFVRRRPAVCAWVNTDVLPNGDVSPCFDLVCGNITRDSFTTIWNNEAFRRHRQRLATEGDFPICARCCAYWRRE